MATFILTWNPDRWTVGDSAYEDWVDRTVGGGLVHEPWSTGRRSGGISIGDRAFLLRQHHDRGIVASGTFRSDVYEDEHWDPARTGTTANYADVAWETWLAPEDRLPTEALETHLPAVGWNPQSSGVEVPTVACRDLDLRWEAHLDALGIDQTWLPDEVRPSETFTEGASTKVTVNRYERDHRARAACLAHHGPTCAVCGFDFEAVYGDLGKGFIHVHHIKELSTLGSGYQVDPVKDLRPVCPNCHAMLHRERPALSIRDLRERLGTSIHRGYERLLAPPPVGSTPRKSTTFEESRPVVRVGASVF